MAHVLFFAAVATAVSLAALLAIACVIRHPPGRIPLDLDAFCRGVPRNTFIPDPHVLIDDEWIPCDSAKQKTVYFLKMRLNP
jgi:hypothetical protein